MSDFRNAQEKDGSEAGGSRIIGRVLPAAVKLWLRSQLESIEQLDIQLKGRDRQIVSGRLPKVAVSAESAVYQGIHLSRATLSAEDIRINIGQVIRGKPLRLLKAFPVLGEVSLAAEDLNTSLGSDLLADGLQNFWQGLTQVASLAQEIESRYGQLPLQSDMRLHNPQVALAHRQLGLSFYPQTPRQTSDMPVILGAEMAIASGRLLQILSARWLETLSELSDPTEGIAIRSLEGFQWDLGKDTQIDQLVLQPDYLLCRGQLQVNP